MDPRIERVADILVNYSVRVKRGSVVQVDGGPPALALMKAICRKILDAGAIPRYRLSAPDLDGLLLREGDDRQISYCPPSTIESYREIDALISIWCDSNTRSLTTVETRKQLLHKRSRKDLQDLIVRRTAKGQLAWCGALYPTEAYAQDARMSLDEFTDLFFRSCLADKANPVRRWAALHQAQEKLIGRLNKGKTVRITAPGTDLTFSIRGRKFANSCGRDILPDGEIFTSPQERSADGEISFSYPAHYTGREMEGVKLEFRKGRATSVFATKNGDFLKKLLALDEGAALIGEFAIGTNPGILRHTGNHLFDEKIGGTVHLGLGSGYPELGGSNSSALHLDMICDLRAGGCLYLDGEPVIKNGRLTASSGV